MPLRDPRNLLYVLAALAAGYLWRLFRKPPPPPDDWSE